MFERYTERARKVVALAHARAGGGTMTTGHLLLGLLDEEDALAYRVLTELGVTAERATHARRLIARDEREGGLCYTIPCPAGGKYSVTSNLDKAFEYAVREALGFGHNYVGTEHLLLALLRADGNGVAVLAAMRVTADDVRHAVIRHLKGAPEAQAVEAEAPAERRTYALFLRCRNCGRLAWTVLPFGTPTSERPCKHCGVKALDRTALDDYS